MTDRAATVMRIVVNGKPYELAVGTTVAAWLAAPGRPPGPVAVALNRRFVSRAQYATTVLHDGDEVECVAPMQGG